MKETDEKIYFWLKSCPVALVDINVSLIKTLDSISSRYHCACSFCKKLDPEEKLSTSTVMSNGLGGYSQPSRCAKCGRALEAV